MNYHKLQSGDIYKTSYKKRYEKEGEEDARREEEKMVNVGEGKTVADKV